MKHLKWVAGTMLSQGDKFSATEPTVQVKPKIWLGKLKKNVNMKHFNVHEYP